MDTSKYITVSATVKSDIHDVWDTWTKPKHIEKWNSPSPDWHTPKAENDLKKRGRFSSRMEAKDGSFGFDFGGIYDEVVPNQKINYTIDDGRKVEINFEQVNDGVLVTEVFEPENQNSMDMQQQGWQAILDNFKSYVESK